MKKDLILNLILIVVLFLAYSNHFNNPFHFDDSHTIENNIFIKDLNNISLFFKDASTFSSNPANQTYRPIVSLSFAISYYFAGDLKPLYFHINIFLFFVLQIILMYFLFKKILSKYLVKKSHLSILSILIVAWYALHTANAETINYVSSISDLYSAFFIVLAMCIYIYAPKLRKWQLYLIPVVIGMLAKEQTAAFAPILFFYILIFEANLEKGSIFNKSNLKIILKAFVKSVPAFIVCGLMSLLVIKMQPESFTPGGQSVFLYILIQPWVLLRYFIAFFLPLNLSADTDWTIINNVFDERIIIGFLFLIGLLILATRGLNKEKFKIISFGIFWFLLALTPTAVVPLAEVTNDHRMFFPFVGLVISVGWSLYLLSEYLFTKLKNKKALKITVSLFVFLVLAGNAYGVYQRNKVWSSGETLWYDVTIKSPNNGRGLMNYGLSQMKKGNYEIAHEYFTKALQLTPYYSYLHVNMAILENSMGNANTAESYFQQALKYSSNSYMVYYHYADFLFKQNRVEESLNYAETALSLSPNYLNIRHLLYDVYTSLNNKSKLKDLIDETLKIFPKDETSLLYKNIDFDSGNFALQKSLALATENPSAENYLNLSLAYYHNGMYNECIKACEEALKIKPDYSLAYNNICSAYNMLEEYDKAIEACEAALKIEPDYTLAFNNLELAKHNKSK